MPEWKRVVVGYPKPKEGHFASKAEGMLTRIWLEASDTQERDEICAADEELCDHLTRKPHSRDPVYNDRSEVIFCIEWKMLRAYYKTEVEDETLYVIIGAYYKVY